MINVYLVSFEKTVKVIEERYVDAYTMEQASQMILNDDSVGTFGDQYVYEDVEVIGIKGIKHIGVRDEYAV